MPLDDSAWDVVVLGGGLAGVAAGFEAAKTGKRTLIIERRPALGWEVSWAHAPGNVAGAGSLAEAVTAKITSLKDMSTKRLDPAFFEIALDEVLEQAQAEVLLYAQPVHLMLADGVAQAVAVATKGGTLVLRARAFVDATENGLFWQQTGATGDSLPTRGRYSISLWTGPGCDAADIGDIGHAMNVQLTGLARPEMADLSFELKGASVRDARLLVPDVLKAARAPNGPLAENAIVTHTAPEVLPIACGQVQGAPGQPHAQVGNLFGAGSWLLNDSAPDSVAASLIRAGTASGVAAAKSATAAPDPATFTQPAVPMSSSRECCDVLVVGGGTAGALAILAAARRGQKTTLIEAGTCLGGVGAAGGIHSYYYGIRGGLQDEVDERVATLAPLFGPPDRVRAFHPDAKKVAFEIMAREAGVDVHYGAMLCGAVTETVATRAPARLGGPDRAVRRVREASVACADGMIAYAAQVFIDASGDGDLAGLAGAECRFGREGDGLLHAYTLSSGRINVGEAPDDFKMGIVNFDAGFVDPTDSADLTRARRDALRLYPKQGNDNPTYIAPILGVRCGRLVVGDQTLTMADLITGRRFPDAVLETYGHYDNHARDYEFESDTAAFWTWVLGHWRYQMGAEIPYGVMLPKALEGVLVACRAISVTPDSHHLFRMQNDMQRLGEVAGIAADLAIKSHCTPRHVDVTALQAELIASGALVKPGEPPRFIQLRDNALGAKALPAPDTATDLESELTGDKGSGAIVQLTQMARSDEGARTILKRAVEHQDPAVRMRAAAGLAMCMDHSAVPALMQALQERQGAIADEELRCMQPAWYGAMVMLGRLQAREAAPAVLEVVKDESTPFDPFIAGIRALGRVGDASVAEELEALIGQETHQAFRDSKESAAPIHSDKWDRRWQLDLTLADALARLGRPQPQLVAPYLKDKRAPVRRFAAMVQERSEAI